MGFEKLELPKDAIREALMNAFIHRDYFSNGHIQVNIFIDTIEISNPGGLVKGLKKEDLGKISLPRNSLLFDLLSRTSYVEKAGTGIKRIKDSMKEYGLKVEFKSTGFFTVIFQRKGQDKTPKETLVNGTVNGTVNIIDEMKKNPNITYNELAKSFGKGRRTIVRYVDKLKKEGKIKRVGPAKGGSWEVLK